MAAVTDHGQIFELNVIKVMIQVGYLAANHGFVDESRRVMDAVSILRPKSAAPYVGHAMSAAKYGNFEEAVRVLESKALSLEPDNIVVRSFIGLYLWMGGKDREAQSIMADIIENSEGADEAGVHLAKDVLEAINNQRSMV